MQRIAVVFLCTIWLFSCRQQPSGSRNKSPEFFQSKYVSLIKDTSVMMLIENVQIRYGDLYIESDSALLDKPNHSITAYGIKNFRFKGKEVDKTKYGTLVSYKLGDSRFYSE